MTEPTDAGPAAPKLFISYSWTSPEHEAWVLSLATELRESRVDVILDKWDLKEGQDANAFMEKMVTEPEVRKVILICDRVYAEKADGRLGGVGTETQIISAEVYAKQDQTKFVAVLPERDESGNAYLPTYYKSRKYIDLSGPDVYGRGFEQLLRWVYDKPLYVKPELGRKPKFLDEEESVSLQTTVVARRALEALKDGRQNWAGAVQEYFETFAENLERIRISKDSGPEDFGKAVLESIAAFLPYRNEVVGVVAAAGRYRPEERTWRILHGFFEQLIPYLDRPDGVVQWQEHYFDNFRFVIQEMFLRSVAVLIRVEDFGGVAYLLGQSFYVRPQGMGEESPMRPFTVFQRSLESLEPERRRRKRLSLHGDLLMERNGGDGLTFQQLMQADLVLFIRDCLDSVRIERSQRWWPHSLVFSERQYGPFEVFARCESERYFESFKRVLGVGSPEEIRALKDAFGDRRLQAPRWDYVSVEPFVLMGASRIATRP